MGREAAFGGWAGESASTTKPLRSGDRKVDPRDDYVLIY